MTIVRAGVASVLVAFVVGCGAAPPASAPPTVGPPSLPGTIPPALAAKFAEGLAAMTRHDRAGDWTAEACRGTAALFIEAADLSAGPAAAKAHYDAAVAHQRCGDHGAARPELAAAVRADPKCHSARMHLALYALQDSSGKDLDRAIAEIQRAALDSEFQNVEALVNLATLQMRRQGATRDEEGNTDIERAKKNLQRALAVDDGYLPAYNQLAVLHLETARRAAGRAGRAALLAASPVRTQAGAKTDTQTLELAALVCSQAMRRDPAWAPIHNTAGLIQAELGNLGGAVAEFNTARRLDGRLFEAQMNAAAVNLSFRGFGEAERAYRAALGLRPDDYEARLGLALALRGQIDESNFDRMTTAAETELVRAKKLAPERAETYYNEAILRQEYKAKFGGPGGKSELEKAKGLFQRFVEKAGKAPEYADAVKRSQERMGEIDVILALGP